MKLKEYVELVLLNVNGGVLSPDDSVLRVDIRAYAPVAINKGLDNAYNENRAIEGDGSLPSQFYGFFGPIALDTTSKPFTFLLEKGTVPLKGGYGLKNVVDDAGNFYAPVPDNQLPNLKYMVETVPCLNWYRRVGQDKIEVYTDNDLLESISYQAIADISKMDDDDELPIQAGQEPLVMEIAINHFRAQRGMPYDNASDNKDDANASR